jgi:hypothetical protein
VDKTEDSCGENLRISARATLSNTNGILNIEQRTPGSLLPAGHRFLFGFPADDRDQVGGGLNALILGGFDNDSIRLHANVRGRVLAGLLNSLAFQIVHERFGLPFPPAVSYAAFQVPD